MHLDLVMQPCRNVFSVQCKRTLLDLVVRNGNLTALVSEFLEAGSMIFSRGQNTKKIQEKPQAVGLGVFC